jgi:hypothetical protein
MLSLKAFHLFFIVVSALLAAYMTAWAAGQYLDTHETGYAVTVAACSLTACVLAAYATVFQRKARRL